MALAVLLFSLGTLGQVVELGPGPDYKLLCQEFFSASGFLTKQTNSGMTIFVGGNATVYRRTQSRRAVTARRTFISPALYSSDTNQKDILAIIEVGFNALTMSILDWEEMGCSRKS